MELNIENAPKFINLLEEIEDSRDNRGKRHNLHFIIASVVIAILSDRSTMSGIHRFISNKIEWLREVLDRPSATVVSRAQLPRILDTVDWHQLNKHVEEFFERNIEGVDGEWVAIDGKVLRGTIKDKRTKAHENEKVATAVGHQSTQTIHQRPIPYGESDEILAVRQLLDETPLSTEKVTLDSLHIQSSTLEIINLDGGEFIVQVKSNQLNLYNQLELISGQTPAYIHQTYENNRSRTESRIARFFDIEQIQFDSKWSNCGFKTLIVLDRKRIDLKSGKQSDGRYYYLSNCHFIMREKELFNAIRQHWQVEVNNNIRDVILREDYVKTGLAKCGQVLSLLRTLALNIIREVSPASIKKALHKFADCPDFLKGRLKQINFL